MELRNFFS